MKIETITRTKLIADEGMVLTNGTDYGRIVFLADNDNDKNWREITEEEYEEIIALTTEATE